MLLIRTFTEKTDKVNALKMETNIFSKEEDYVFYKLRSNYTHFIWLRITAESLIMR